MNEHRKEGTTDGNTESRLGGKKAGKGRSGYYASWQIGKEKLSRRQKGRKKDWGHKKKQRQAGRQEGGREGRKNGMDKRVDR